VVSSRNGWLLTAAYEATVIHVQHFFGID